LPADGSKDGGLSVTGSLFGGYDDSLLIGPGLQTPVEQRSRSHDPHTGLSGQLLYERPGDPLSVRASASSSARYYPGLERLSIGRQSADFSSSSVTSPWRGAQLHTSGMARVARYGGPFAGATFLPQGFPLDMFDGDNVIRLRRTDVLLGNVALEQEWGRRKSIGIVAGVQSSGLEGSERAVGYNLGGTLSTRISRYSTLRTGYTREEINRGVSQYVVHHLNIGGNYSRPLSTSRRAFVMFSGGSAVLDGNGQVRMQAIADASLHYQLGRSWLGSARYHRGFMFLDEIAGPLSSDGVVAELNGLLSRRLELFNSASFTHGSVGLSPNSTPYNAYSARSQIRYALSRLAAIYAEYLLFDYRFAGLVQLGGNLPSYFNRQTVRAGVTFATPVFR
jgi:hypothetical protein